MRILALFAGILVLGAIAWEVTATAHTTSPRAPVIAGGATEIADAASDPMAERSIGSPSAPVTIVEYFSLTCPHCAKFEQDTFPQLKAEYIDTGKVRYVARDFPFDKPGLRAAMMARCAPADRYFPLVDLLFKGQEKWGLSNDPEGSMAPLGRFAGMSDADIKACFGNKDLENFVVGERKDAETKFKINSTPSFVFNDGADQFSGAQPYDKFKAAIDGLLASAGARKSGTSSSPVALPGH